MPYQKVEPTLWTPENEGDEIAGKLSKVDTEIGKHKSKVYHLEMENKNILSVYGSKVLDDKMSFIKVGEKIKIIYLGRVKGKDAEYKNFDVERWVDD